ncbi:MAG: RDD family protein [Bdellovibrionales bacterium]|nr:RDD family protein [Bdellovibrionales bacterium]
MNFDLNSNQRHAFSTWQLAGPRRRALSFLVDLGLSALVAWGISMLLKTPSPLQSTASALSIILVFWVHVGLAQTFFGYSIGQKAFGLKLFAPRLDDRPEPIQVASRMIALWAGVFFGFIGITPILWRRDRRGWQDSLSDSLVFGPHLEAPTEAQIKTGTNIFSAQVYTLSGLGLAALVTFSLINGNPQETSQQAESSALCQDLNFILNHAQEVVVATAISPSWSQCWQETKFNLGTLMDSELARLIRFSYLHFEITTSENPTALTSEAQEMAKIESSLCRDQQDQSACPSERLPASEDRPTYLVFKKFIGPHFELVDHLFAKSNRAERLTFLKDTLKSPAITPLIKSALEERIWAEELAMGKPAAHLNFDSYDGWARIQSCWLQSLYPEMQKNSCVIENFSFFTHMLSEPGEAWNQDSVDYRLRDVRSRNDLPPDFEKALSMIRAKTSGSKEEIEAAWSQVSRLSPLYSIAEAWAKKGTTAQ